MITFVQCALIVGAIGGGGLSFDLFERGNVRGGFLAGFLAIVGLAGVVTLELLVKR